MMLVRWTDPFGDLAHLQDRINRVFSESQGHLESGARGSRR